MAESSEIFVIAQVEETVEPQPEGRRDGRRDVGGGWGTRGTRETVAQMFTRKRVPVDAQVLKTQMQGLISVVNDLFTEAANNSQGLQLDEVELAVEINAEGQLSLVGNGGKLGNTGGITLKFVRPQ